MTEISRVWVVTESPGQAATGYEPPPELTPELEGRTRSTQ